MNLCAKNRFSAFGFHFLVSLFVGVIFAYLILTNWYREPFFTADGGWFIFRMIFIVHLVLGPVLTLIIYKPGKKGLKFDLGVIAAAQCLALIYGGTVLYQERPIFMAFSVDRFVLVSSDDIDFSKIRFPGLLKNQEEQPIPVYARMPEDPNDRNQFVKEVFQGQPDLEFRPEYYEPFRENFADIAARGKDIDQLKHVSEHNEEVINTFLKTNCTDGCVYIPLIAKKRDILLALNNKDGSVAGGIDIDPWVSTQAIKSAKFKD